jgi:hypothetical protein
VEKWIIEADVYRLHKQLRDGPSPEVRPVLLDLLHHKEALLRQAR